jgi:hypothetical protein
LTAVCPLFDHLNPKGLGFRWSNDLLINPRRQGEAAAAAIAAAVAAARAKMLDREDG